jgi:hypothetical protein
MPIFVLKHPSSDYQGFAHGVDFVKGKGSTSNESDKDFLVSRIGCEVIETQGQGKSAGVAQSAPASISAEYKSDEQAIADMNRSMTIAEAGKKRGPGRPARGRG